MYYNLNYLKQDENKEVNMRIAICGANSFVGTHLSSSLVSNSHEVVRIGREHFKDIEFLVDCLDGCDAVVNFCGEPFLKKWDELYKNKLYISRIETTKKLVKAISSCQNKPKKIVIASSVKIYKEALNHDEFSKEYCTDYLALLIKEYEQAAKEVEKLGIKAVILRFGYILGLECGLIKELKKLYKYGMGFIIGDGKQPLSWVHVDDVCEVVKISIQKEQIQGVYNIVSSEIVSMKTFTTTLGKYLKKPVFLKLPFKALKFFYAEGAENLIKGSFVTSSRFDEFEYKLSHENLDEALDSLFR